MRGAAGRWLLLLALGAGAVFAARALPRLRFDHDSRSLQREDADLDALEDELAAAFGSEDLLLVAWEVESALDAETFRQLQAVTRDIEKVKGMEEAYSLASPIVQLPLGGALRPILEQDLSTPEGKAEVRRALLDSPVYLGTIYSEDLEVVAVAGTLAARPREEREATLRAIREVARRHEQPGRPIRVAGVTALAVEAGEYAVRDLKRIGLLALVVSLIVLFVLCRSVRETLVAVAATGLPPLYALGCAAALAVPVTALGAALFPVLAVVGITSSVHLLNAYREARLEGTDVIPAAWGAARRLSAPIVLSLFTTAIAFGSLQATGVPAFRSAGTLVAAGLLLAIPVVLLGLPAALILVRPPPGHGRKGSLDRALETVAAWVPARRGWIVLGACVLCAGGAWSASRARLQVAVLQAFERDSEIVQTYRFLEDRLTATIPADVVLQARPDAKDADVLEDLRRFTTQAHEHDAVKSTLSLATLVSYGKKVSPIRVNEAGALLVLRQLFKAITRRFEHLESRRYRIKIRVREGTPPEVLDHLDAATASFQTGDAFVTGLYLRAVGTTRSLVRDLARGALLMTVVVLLTVAVALRSVRLGLAAVVPNALPPALVFGGAALFGVALDVSAVAVGAVAVGLAVDDTLHVVFRLAAERRAGRSDADALRNTLRSVGRALVLSSVVLVAGLGCLAFSGFLPTARFGVFAAAACAIALPADLVALPAFVRLFRAI